MQDTSLVIELTYLKLSEIVVKASKQKLKSSPESINLPIKQLERIPTIGGEADIMKSLALTPGVSIGQEGTSNLYVRGGTPDQNLILLDGMPVYNATHLGGYFSVFNSDALNSVNLIKGGFPARYGGRLSSVLDIQMYNGNSKEFKGKAGIGLATSQLFLTGPIKKDESAFMISARSSYFGLLKSLAPKDPTSSNSYWMYDINAKGFQKMNKGTLFLSFYFGNDKGSSKYNLTSKGDISNNTSNKDNINWGNLTTSARYSIPLGKKLFGKFLLGYTNYHYTYNYSEVVTIFDTDTTKTSFSYQNNSLNQDIVLKSDFEYTHNNQHKIRFGAGITPHRFSISTIDSTLKVYQSLEYVAYLEDDLKIHPKLNTNIGLRATAYQLEEKFYSGLEPRLSITYKPISPLSMHAGMTIMKQYIHLLPNNGFGFPNDIWVPVTKNVKPQTAIQYSGGLNYQITNSSNVSLDGYYKKIDNQISFKKALKDPFSQIENWEELIEKEGVGMSYGAELLLQKQMGRWTGFAGYTLSWNKRQFQNLNNGKPYFFTYDRRHDFSISMAYQWTKKLLASANWVYNTGRAVTLPVGRTPLQAIYAGRNNHRLPDYHRMDIGLEYTRTTKQANRWIWNFSIYNLYNQINPNFIRVRTELITVNNQYVHKPRELVVTSLFSFFPAFAIKYEF